MLLQDKVAVVTGAGAGFGRESALVFGEQGAKVVVSDLESNRVAQVVGELRSADIDAIGMTTNVSHEADVAALVDRAVDHFGRIDVMYNNAGFTDSSTWKTAFEDSSEDSWQRIIGVNLSGVYYGIKHAARFMKDHGGGSIIVSSSAAAFRAVPGQTMYAAAKAGAGALVQNSAVDLGKYNIRVNAVAPASFVPNNFVSGPGAPVLEESAAWKLVENSPTAHIPLGRLGSRRELANVALFLASDLSSFVTGVTIPVDGGVTRPIKASPDPNLV